MPASKQILVDSRKSTPSNSRGVQNKIRQISDFQASGNCLSFWFGVIENHLSSDWTPHLARFVFRVQTHDLRDKPIVKLLKNRRPT
jgi:hypothetical protein